MWRAIFFGVGLLMALALFASCIAAIVSREPANFESGLILVLPASLWGWAECRAYFRQTSSVEKCLGYTYIVMGSLILFAAGTATFEGQESDLIQDAKWILAAMAIIGVYLLAAGRYRTGGKRNMIQSGRPRQAVKN